MNLLCAESPLASSTCERKSNSSQKENRSPPDTLSSSAILISGDLLNACGTNLEEQLQFASPLTTCQILNELDGIKNLKTGSPIGTTIKDTAVGALRNHMQPWSVRRTLVKRLLLDVFAAIDESMSQAAIETSV